MAKKLTIGLMSDRADQPKLSAYSIFFDPTLKLFLEPNLPLWCQHCTLLALEVAFLHLPKPTSSRPGTSPPQYTALLQSKFCLFRPYLFACRIPLDHFHNPICSRDCSNVILRKVQSNAAARVWPKFSARGYSYTCLMTKHPHKCVCRQS